MRSSSVCFCRFTQQPFLLYSSWDSAGGSSLSWVLFQEAQFPPALRFPKPIWGFCVCLMLALMGHCAGTKVLIHLLPYSFFNLDFFFWGLGVLDSLGFFFFMFSVVSSLKHCSLIMKLRRKEYSTVLGNVRQINNEAVNHS